MISIKSIIKNDSPILDTFNGIAPGTDRHCLNVSALCSEVCSVIEGIDKDNLIVAARMHDIGKCNNPLYFSENQDPDTNIHDTLEPSISYQYISRHVSDGVLKLIQLGFSYEIVRIVSEHHGDSVVGAIYNKSRKKNNGSTVIDHYRYKSNKTSCVESCILMICDIVESACRSLSNSGKLNDSKNIVDKLINDLIDDEQLDVLTIGQIRLIKKILLKEISSIYHKRVDYDDEIDIDE